MTRFSECESKKFWSITYYIHGVADFVMVVIFVIVRLWLRGYRSLKKGVLKNVSEGLVAKPTTRQVIVHICVFLYQGYDMPPCCRRRHDVALPPPQQPPRLLPPRCHRRAVRCRRSAAAKLPPTLLCRAAATASPPPSCRRRPLSRCRHRRSCRPAAAKLPPPPRRCQAAAAAAPLFVGWLLRCCPPSDFVIACRHATINALVAGRFRR